MKFRPDINGLRAWAVIAVVLYHFEVHGFASGFVGVDIFFVISGYLMTRIIVEGFERRDKGDRGFTIIGFYLARARRIVPALAFFGLIMLSAGWFALTTEEYRSLGSEALFALTFTSNYKYWLNLESSGGYFADVETLRWFLHSWSLSVEWQFYLLLPLLVGAIWKISRSRRIIIFALSAVLGISFLASIFEVNRDSELAFYSIHTRAWEMLAGGMVFFVQSKFSVRGNIGIPLELAGFLLILASIFVHHPESDWPGYRAALPVVGTMLVLLANRQNSIWTNTPLGQYLGKISYSIYLWHWPIAVMLNYLGLNGMPIWILAGIAITFLLSVISYYLTEKPSRTWIGKRSIWIASVSAVALCLIPAGMGAFVRLTPNLETRPSANLGWQPMAAKSDVNPRRDECHKQGEVPGPMCKFGGARLAAIALGDSHSISIVTALRKALPSENHHVLSMSSSGCLTLMKAERKSPELRCRAYNAWAISKIAEFDESIPVIVSNRFAPALLGDNEDRNSEPTIFYGDNPNSQKQDDLLKHYISDQVSTLCEIAAMRPTYVLRSIPEMGFDVPKILDRRRRFGIRTDATIGRKAYDLRQSVVNSVLETAAEQCQIKLLDPTEFLCSDAVCWGSQDDDIFYTDDDHLSETGNRRLIPMFQTIWDKQ